MGMGKNEAPASSGRRIAAVIPHPDDESYAFAGTLARAADGGARAFVVCATRGEGGWDETEAGRSGETLAAARVEELAASCRAIGAEPPRWLGLPDGGVAAHEARGVERLAAELDALDPDVVLTLGRDGAYGHVDHLATTRIVDAAAAGRRVLHAQFRPGVWAPFFERMRRFAPHVLGVQDASALGTDEADLVVDIRVVQDRKLAAIAAHRSQVRFGDPRRFLIDGLVDRLLDEERFTLASGPPLPDGATDPFEGI